MAIKKTITKTKKKVAKISKKSGKVINKINNQTTTLKKTKFEIKDFNTSARPTWCPGCGNYGIWNSLKRALVAFGKEPHETMIVGGVGCSGKMPHWIKTYGFHGLHGRTLPVATGIKLANNNMLVIAEGGDGDGYDEGTNHLIHAARRNIDICYFVHNNQVFGLTKGQTSPTADPGFISATSPWGAREKPVNPIALAISAGATFVARGFAADINHLSSLMKAAMEHKGFAIIDILQPCVTFNHHNTFDWYNKRVYKLDINGSGKAKHDPSDKVKAFKKSLEWDKGIPIGIIYQESKESFDGAIPQINTIPLVNQPVGRDVSKLIEKYY